MNCICKGPKKRRLTWKVTWEIWVRYTHKSPSSKHHKTVELLLRVTTTFLHTWSEFIDQIISDLVFSIIIHKMIKFINICKYSQQRNLRKYFEVTFSCKQKYLLCFPLEGLSPPSEPWSRLYTALSAFTTLSNDLLNDVPQGCSTRWVS